MRCVGNEKQEKPEVCNRSLKPVQMTSNQDSAVVCQGAHVFWQVGNSASSIARGQVLKPGASIEINVKAAFPDPQAEFRLFIQCRPDCKRFVKPSGSSQY